MCDISDTLDRIVESDFYSHVGVEAQRSFNSKVF